MAFADVGTWWGAGDREIDVVAVDQRGHVTLAGSCKWTNAPLDIADYAALQRDLALAAPALTPADTDHAPWLALFSRQGFTERLRVLAHAGTSSRLWLIDLEAMYAL